MNMTPLNEHDTLHQHEITLYHVTSCQHHITSTSYHVSINAPLNRSITVLLCCNTCVNRSLFTRTFPRREFIRKNSTTSWFVSQDMRECVKGRVRRCIRVRVRGCVRGNILRCLIDATRSSYLWSGECMQYIGAIPRIFVQPRHPVGTDLEV